MATNSRVPRIILLAALIVGSLSGLIAAKYRLHVEGANKRVELGMEWDEVTRLAQFSHQPVDAVLARFKQADVTSLVIQEDTFTTLEQAGMVHPVRVQQPDGHYVTRLDGVGALLYSRIRSELRSRGISEVGPSYAAAAVNSTRITEVTFDDPKAGDQQPSFAVPVDYLNLRTIGLGLPPDAIAAASTGRFQIAGRIGNFPGVDAASARNVLSELADEGVALVIFNGEEVLGYRDMEPQIAAMLKEGAIPIKAPVQSANGHAPGSLAYGAVEFGKQKGDEKLSAKLNGDLIRVHSIQAAEMGQLDREEAIDRFAKAARERNVRFCYVRLLTFAGPDPVGDNVKFVNAVARAIHKGNALTGGGLQFGAARRFQEVGTPRVLYPLMAVGVAGGTIWMLMLFMPLTERQQGVLLTGLAVVLAILAVAGGEMGRKLVALLAGISFPAAACLFTYPTTGIGPEAVRTSACIKRACKAIAVASGITAIGIVHVVGLLASRPYMVHTSQFLGIKAQHAVPLLIITLAALIGGVVLPGEKLRRFKERSNASLREAMSEPARFGTLLFGLVTLAALALIIARTGNDAGVGVSGIELKARAILDRVMPVRPRTKEFLIGHPAFVLGICWWLRGRRKVAIPAFVIGSLGQVSLLNTFCHIHTPLIVSAWRGGTGLVVGVVIGCAVFSLGERLLPAPEPPR